MSDLVLFDTSKIGECVKEITSITASVEETRRKVNSVMSRLEYNIQSKAGIENDVHLANSRMNNQAETLESFSNIANSIAGILDGSFASFFSHIRLLLTAISAYGVFEKWNKGINPRIQYNPESGSWVVDSIYDNHISPEADVKEFREWLGPTKNYTYKNTVCKVVKGFDEKLIEHQHDYTKHDKEGNTYCFVCSACMCYNMVNGTHYKISDNFKHPSSEIPKDQDFHKICNYGYSDGNMPNLKCIGYKGVAKGSSVSKKMEVIIKQIKAGNPVIINTPKKENHYIAVVGVDESRTPPELLVCDPARKSDKQVPCYLSETDYKLIPKGSVFVKA